MGIALLKQPLVFNPDGGDACTDWKADVEVWRLFTKEEKKRQGLAVYLSLQGNAREAVRIIDPKDLATDNGYEKVIKALDGIFLKDETTCVFCAIKNFVEFRCESGTGFAKFLVEFNRRVREVKKYKLVLDDRLMAYFLLTAANLSDDHERLVRATATLNSGDMKYKLQKVFGEFDGNDVHMQIGTLPVKEECLFTKGYNRWRSSCGGRSGQRGGWYQQNSSRGFGQNQDSGQGGDQYSSQHGLYNSSQRRVNVGRSKSQHISNPFDAEGNIMRCHECDSTKHFLNDCPHRRVEGAKMATHVTLIAGSASKGQDVMLRSHWQEVF